MKLTTHHLFHESGHVSLSVERAGVWWCLSRRRATAGSVALLLILAGCGGGPDAEEKRELNFLGTVAVGAALQGVTVEVSCADGSAGNSNPTDSQGYYRMSFAGSLPCNFSVKNMGDGYLMRAIALKEGVVNVTPLTEVQYQLAAGSSAQWSSAGLTLSSAMNALGSPIISDPTTTAFKPDGTGLDKNILDLVAYSKAVNASSATAPLSLVPLVSALSDPSCYMADVPTGVGSTLSTSTKMLVCPKVQVSSQLNDAYLQDLFEEFVVQLDPGFNSLRQSVQQGNLTPAIAEAIERSVTYAAGAMLKGIGSDTAKKLGLSKTHVKIISDAFKKEALESNVISTIQREWKPIEWVVTAFCNAVVSTVQDIWLKKATALDAEGWMLFTGASLEYGLKSYMLEVLVAQVIDCATDGCTTIASPLKNTALTTFGWVYKDLAAGFELLGIRSEFVHSEAFAAFQGTYNHQLISLNEMPSSDLVSWVKSGMPSGIEADLDAVFASEKQKARNTANSVVQGLSQAEAFSLRDMQVARLNRLQASFRAIVDICRKQAVAEGEVGVSKCLNALGVQPSAPTSCVAPAALKMGACITENASIVLQDSFDTAVLDTARWTLSGNGGSTVGSATLKDGALTLAAYGGISTQGKATFSGNRIVVEGRMAGMGTGRDTQLVLVDADNGGWIYLGDTSYCSFGFFGGASAPYDLQENLPPICNTGYTHLHTTGGSTTAWMEYRLTVDGSQFKMERGPTLAGITAVRTGTLGQSIAGRRFYLWLKTGGPVYSPAAYDWVRVAVDGPAAPTPTTFQVAANSYNGYPFTIPAGVSSCKFTASGNWYGSSKEDSLSDADGIGTPPSGHTANDLKAYSLIAKVGASFVLIGKSSTHTVVPGQIWYLKINDADSVDLFTDNRGSLAVSVSCS